MNGGHAVKDQFGRSITYLRISITDRCNLRCRYCMPDGVQCVPMRDILTYEEITEIASAAARLGITDIRVTGGEPLVRRGAPALVGMLKAVPGIRHVFMTTNGVLLAEHLPALLDAGLDGVNISLDTLRADTYQAITGSDALPAAKEGIRAALAAGLPVRLNAVLQKGINEDEWQALAGLARENPLDVRFIEMMPIGAGKNFTGCYNDALLARMKEVWPDINKDAAGHGCGPARYYHIPGWQGSIGLISAMHGRFCDRCNRIRLTAQGILKPCLSYAGTADLRPVLRSGRPHEQELEKAIRDAIYEKPRQHCFGETEDGMESENMNRIGG